MDLNGFITELTKMLEDIKLQESQKTTEEKRIPDSGKIRKDLFGKKVINNKDISTPKSECSSGDMGTPDLGTPNTGKKMNTPDPENSSLPSPVNKSRTDMKDNFMSSKVKNDTINESLNLSAMNCRSQVYSLLEKQLSIYNYSALAQITNIDRNQPGPSGIQKRGRRPYRNLEDKDEAAYAAGDTYYCTPKRKRYSSPVEIRKSDHNDSD